MHFRFECVRGATHGRPSFLFDVRRLSWITKQLAQRRKHGSLIARNQEVRAFLFPRIDVNVSPHLRIPFEAPTKWLAVYELLYTVLLLVCERTELHKGFLTIRCRVETTFFQPRHGRPIGVIVVSE